MVVFDRLQISDDGKWLYADIRVFKASYFDNIYIDEMIIQTQDQVSETDPATPGDQCVYYLKVSGNKKELHLALSALADFDIKDNTLSNKLLFVYVTCKGTPDPCTPCGLDERTTLGVTFDTGLMYQMMMQYTRELNMSCEIPKGMIDMVMLYEGFKAAIETEHYIPAIDFWKKLFLNGGQPMNLTKPCGCHG